MLPLPERVGDAALISQAQLALPTIEHSETPKILSDPEDKLAGDEFPVRLSLAIVPDAVLSENMIKVSVRVALAAPAEAMALPVLSAGTPVEQATPADAVATEGIKRKVDNAHCTVNSKRPGRMSALLRSCLPCVSPPGRQH